MSFKENLQYLRGSRNMTQEQLAMLLGVSRQAISKWESEKAYPEMGVREGIPRNGQAADALRHVRRDVG